jgi:arabinose-5-phosphate isomerase
MNYITRGQRVFDIEIACLKATRERLGKDFSHAVELMLETLENGGKLVVTGVGKSGLISHKIASTLTSTGAPTIVLDALNAAHGDLGLIAKDDLLLMLSYSGRTEELIRILPSLKRLQCKIISITGNAKSPVAKAADVHLDVAVEKEACPLNLAPTSSTTTMLALGDALAMVLLDARGFKKEDFARFHPGGTLGRYLLTKVEQIMRPLSDIAVCKKEDTVLTALSLITRKRCGAAVVVNRDKTLAGIYTHGDFARGFQKDKNIGDKKLGSVMTKKPLYVEAGKLAVEALNVFEKHKIEDLIVLDKSRRPVGLIDAQDLTKTKLI